MMGSVLTTELNALPADALALSSVGGAQGLFSAEVPLRWAIASLTLGGPLASALTGSPAVDVWLLRSADRVSFEYGTANGNLTAAEAQVSNLPSSGGVYFNSGVPAQGAYVFDLTVPGNLLPATYVVGIFSSTAVTLSLPAVATATNDLFAFVNPPARAADFTVPFAVRPYMGLEVVSAAPSEVAVPERSHYKVLLRNRLGAAFPSVGNVLTLEFVPDALAVELGRWGASPGLVRTLGRGGRCDW